MIQTHGVAIKYSLLLLVNLTLFSCNATSQSVFSYDENLEKIYIEQELFYSLKINNTIDLGRLIGNNKQSTIEDLLGNPVGVQNDTSVIEITRTLKYDGINFKLINESQEYFVYEIELIEPASIIAASIDIKIGENVEKLIGRSLVGYKSPYGSFYQVLVKINSGTYTDAQNMIIHTDSSGNIVRVEIRLNLP